MLIITSVISFNNYFSNITYSASMFIILIYVFLTFTLYLLLNTFDLKYIKTLSDLKKFGIIFPFNLLFLILILSFAGIPPLFGFSVKLILFLIVIKSSIYFYILLLSLFNFFTLYFYIQNVRYIVNNSQNNYFIYTKYFVVLSEQIMFILFITLIVNIGGILYLGDFFNIINILHL